jgi:23S rRNA-/tRNA-specific pseudouridylate synthase
VRKAYTAVCVGVPMEATFAVGAPIGEHPREKVARRVAPDGLPALTSFTLLASNPAFDLETGGVAGRLMDGGLTLRGSSLLRCEPHSGRTHQIRVHLAHAGHPIIGDEMYGLQVLPPPPCQYFYLLLLLLLLLLPAAAAQSCMQWVASCSCCSVPCAPTVMAP